MIRGNKKGFTIIELLLAMTIVSLLLVAIATMTMQMISIMTKGNTFKDLNAAARTINDDFTRSFNSISSIDDFSVTDRYSSSSRYINVAGDYGIFCTGDVSYLWNYANAINDDKRSLLSVRYGNDTSGRQSTIRLIKVEDSTRKYCTDSKEKEKIPRNSSQVKEIIIPGENSLMIYDMKFATNANLRDSSSNQSMVNISYVLGTRGDDGRVNVSGLQCNPSSEFREYCAINKFDLTVRTIGRR